MKKMNKVAALLVALLLVATGIAGSVQAKTSTEIDFDAFGSLYVGFVGLDMDHSVINSTANTVFGETIDTLYFAGDFVVGMNFVNGYTIDRIVVFGNGYAGFDQIYYDHGESFGTGVQFGTGVESSQLGVLWSLGNSTVPGSLGYSTGALAHSDSYVIYQYAGSLNPAISIGADLGYSGPEGYGFSVMNVQLLNDYPAITVTDWTDLGESAPEAFGLDPEDCNGVQVIDLDSNYGFFVDILSLWKSPLDIWFEMDHNILAADLSNLE